jgi:hypothetical protein
MEGDEEKNRRRDGQEGNRDPTLLERGSGENSGPKTRESGNISARNSKLYPAYAEPDQGVKELLTKVKRQREGHQKACQLRFFDPEKFFPVGIFFLIKFFYLMTKNPFFVSNILKLLYIIPCSNMEQIGKGLDFKSLL